MSDAGREDVWTDLESLLKKAGAEADERPEEEDRIEEVELRASESGGDHAESSGLPYQDLLSELLGSWSDDEGGGQSPEAAAGTEAGVPLSALMARLEENPWPPPEASAGEPVAAAVDGREEFEEPTASIEALQTCLREAGGAGDEPKEGEFAAEADLTPPAAEMPASVEMVELDKPEAEFNEPAMPETAFAVEAPDWSATAASLPAEEFLEEAEAGAGAQEEPPERGEDAPVWTADLFDALVRADEENQPATPVEALQQEPDSEFVAAEPLPEPAMPSGQRDGWEILASLPAPAMPSFSEPILFEPPLPADSTVDWPVVETQPSVIEPAAEQAAFEESEAGSETESDDALRRLVGQMLAEMAAASAPRDRSHDTESAAQKATERFLSFSLAGEVYAVALAGILETDRLPKVTRVPGLPAWAIGVSNLRGSILPVVDLRRLLSLEEAENPQDGRILVVRTGPADAPSALVVDRLEGVALLSPGELHPAPLWLDSKILPYLEGIGSFKGRLVNVLDLSRLFAATGVSGDAPVRAGEPR
jgi:chemotaxis signal transduction protein